MGCLQPSWLSALNTMNTISPSKPTLFPPSTNFIISHSFKPLKQPFSLNSSNSESSEPVPPNSPESTPDAKLGAVDPVKLAFEKAKAYKKEVKSKLVSEVEQNPVEDSGVGGVTREVPVSVKVAMEKAKEYNKSKGVVSSGTKGGEGDAIPSSIFESRGLNGGKGGSLGNGIVEKTVNKKGELSVSSIDFMGLNFADKKSSRGLPPGLVPVSDSFPEEDLTDVEFIVGDTSKFEDTTASQLEQPQEHDSNLYKPKVSSWGVFPRPGNISRTFGGGRVIRPGEVLETAEEKAAKEARTRELLAAYKSKTGLKIDPKLKSECQEALKDGDSLMNLGKLKEALPYYKKVMEKLTFQSELHGLAALQWSICQDSLSRPNEARSMYEKLQSHPNVQVSKKARQFMFSFQAMEMMKFTTSTPFYLKNAGYQNFFEAFIEKKSNYPLKKVEFEEGGLNQVLPYIIFLVSPIFALLIIVVQKRI
ncbi:uncharacterized protein LOC108981190 [Juglans regia]|uniref:Uncharacterized protein LOC108981190 n=2 Tax=Juglans regia TaxID=51240 RepID=A0A2I4DKZ7_JUGRE|nr:uncharacterized protein LOC108981190 [Juglans regia]